MSHAGLGSLPYMRQGSSQRRKWKWRGNTSSLADIYTMGQFFAILHELRWSSLNDRLFLIVRKQTPSGKGRQAKQQPNPARPPVRLRLVRIRARGWFVVLLRAFARSYIILFRAFARLYFVSLHYIFLVAHSRVYISLFVLACSSILPWSILYLSSYHFTISYLLECISSYVFCIMPLCVLCSHRVSHRQLIIGYGF